MPTTIITFKDGEQEHFEGYPCYSTEGAHLYKGAHLYIHDDNDSVISQDFPISEIKRVVTDFD